MGSLAKTRYASIAFQAAVKASVGVGGYAQLAQAVGDIGHTLGAVGAHYLQGSFARVAGFIHQFAPKGYNKDVGPVVPEIGSEEGEKGADGDSLPTTVDWMQKTAEGRVLWSDGIRPRAFETSFATEVSVAYALAVQGSGGALLEVQQRQQGGFEPGERLAGRASRARRSRGSQLRIAEGGPTEESEKSRSRGRKECRSRPLSWKEERLSRKSSPDSIDVDREVRGTKRGRLREAPRKIRPQQNTD